ncbi:MAG: hypothetical protein IKD76_02845 [Clostridia bacterium]|nr:hypothetical protein [Clostridia bacterium]
MINGNLPEYYKKLKEVKEIEEQKKRYEDWKKRYDKRRKEALDVGLGRDEDNIARYNEIMKEVRKIENENPDIYNNRKQMREIEEKLARNKEEIASKEKEEDALAQEANNTMKELFSQKESALTTNIKKQNALQKFMGGILNRISGKSRFEKNVIQPLKNDLKNFKEKTLPGFIENANKIAKSTLKESKLSKSVLTLIQISRKAQTKFLNDAKTKIVGKTNTINQKIEEKNQPKKETAEMEI